MFVFVRAVSLCRMQSRRHATTCCHGVALTCWPAVPEQVLWLLVLACINEIQFVTEENTRQNLP